MTLKDAKKMSEPIVVVGSINVDLVATAARLPHAGETISGEHFGVYFGGKGANQAVAIAKLGYPISMIGKVGNDNFGPELRAALKDAGVEVSAIEATDCSSGIALIATSRAGENSIIVVPGANGRLQPEDLESRRELIESATIVLTQLEIGLPTILRLAEITDEAEVPLMLDPAPACQLPDELARRIDWITPNETEIKILLGLQEDVRTGESIASAAEQLMKRGPRNVVLKLGERGAFLAEGKTNRAFIPSFKVSAVDTTAAGDAFNGAFAVGLAKGRSPIESAGYAAAVAAISVTRQGAQPSMPTAAEVEEFLCRRL